MQYINHHPLTAFPFTYYLSSNNYISLRRGCFSYKLNMEAINPLSPAYLRVITPGYTLSDVASHFGLLMCLSRGQHHIAMVSLLLMREIMPEYVL